MQTYPGSCPMGLTQYIPKVDDPSTTTIKFDPSLWLQRYAAVVSVLHNTVESEAIRTITEFGANNFNFFVRALESVDWLEKVNLVDVDENVLLQGLQTIRDERWNRTSRDRLKSLTAYVYRGNVALEDHRVADTDAVVAIEVIEHLTRDDFERFPQNVFGYMRPARVVLTTPNRDFNPLFGMANGVLRHPDHKFEFTRREFRDWATAIVRRYPAYEFEIYGVGEAPLGTEPDVGYASQMAVFARGSHARRTPADHRPEAYALLERLVLHAGDDRTPAQRARCELVDAALRALQDMSLDNRDLVYMRRERCPDPDGHRMDVAPARTVVERLRRERRFGDVDVETLLAAFRQQEDVAHRYDVERTLAVGPAFVCECECWSQPHDDAEAVDDGRPDDRPPSVRVYAELRPGAGGGGSGTRRRRHRRRRRRALLEEGGGGDEGDVCGRVERFVEAACASNWLVQMRRVRCPVEHSISAVTPAMIVAHLRANGVRTDEQAVLATWAARGNRRRYPLEETAHGPVIVGCDWCLEDCSPAKARGDEFASEGGGEGEKRPASSSEREIEVAGARARHLFEDGECDR